MGGGLLLFGLSVDHPGPGFFTLPVVLAIIHYVQGGAIATLSRNLSKLLTSQSETSPWTHVLNDYCLEVERMLTVIAYDLSYPHF